jgi:acyl-[acyl-carrier-protein]-phospholipid O-acyltransferase/long-chain-fatty-acid--[acyl-carrier-protein] ligase
MSIAPEDPSIAPTTENGRGGVYSLAFLALVATQFFVSLNDNMFRWLVVPIGKELMDKNWGEMPELIRHWMKPESLALSLGLASFTLPFLVFAAPAGFLADRFSKRRVMVACKVAELAVVGFGVVAIVYSNVPLMFLTLFILGGQAMMFITSKFGAIPELVRHDKISEANGLINMVSMSAIILGGLAGNCICDMTKPAGQHRWWISATALLGVAACGLVTSLFIGRLRPANPARAIPWNPASQTYRDLRELFSKRPLFLAASGSAFFWALGALSQLNIDQFATNHLFFKDQMHVGLLLGTLTIGIGIGAVVAGKVSHNKVELGLVPLGGFGIALSSMAMFLIPGGAAGQPSYVGYGMGCVFLLSMGATAGLYDIPLQAFLQERSPVESRGSIMAAYNFLCFSGMLSASVVYWVLSGPLGLPSGAIFFVGGLATVFVTIMIVRLLPFHTTRLAMRLLIKCMYRVRLEGLENVPAGGALVVSNHISWADGVLLGLSCPRHPRMIAFAEYFASPWLSWFGRLGRIIPIGTTRKSMVESIRASREALQQGELVCIFPEGGITRTGKIEEFRPGFLSILKETDAPVVPVYLGGLWGSIFSYEGGKFFWKWPHHWRAHVSIRFGKPIYNPETVDQVRQAVEELQNEK